jgi:hypothetical protein
VVPVADTRLTRVTVNLTAASTTALDELVATTGDSRTDVINKALRIYRWFSTTADTGRLRYLGADGEQETVVIL